MLVLFKDERNPLFFVRVVCGVWRWVWGSEVKVREEERVATPKKRLVLTISNLCSTEGGSSPNKDLALRCIAIRAFTRESRLHGGWKMK